MHRIWQRLRSNKRWAAGDLTIRAVGGALLGLCAGAAFWLYRSVHRPPAHATCVADLGAAALIVVCWATGWAALSEGQGLFWRIDVPARHAHFDPVNRGQSL